MVAIKSTNDLIQELLDYFKIVQSNLDTKPGTVARDLFIDAPSSQLAILYDSLSRISEKQSFRLTSGTDLTKLAQNFGLYRKNGAASTGVAILTFKSIDANIGINVNDLVYSNNGFSFSVVTGTTVSASSINLYKSIASKYRNQLDFVGISDEYAVLITVKATTSGSAGNIGAYSLSRTSINGVNNITNIESFGGGTDQESELSFKNRIFSTFSGSSVGTTLGYLNTALSTTNVLDAVVIEPGDILMTRDGTVVKNGEIVSEGTGGKVDVIILGSSLIEKTDSFIFRDKSNNNDPSNDKNDFVLGQISSDIGKTISKKRKDNIASGILPSQPIDNVLEVTGSLSGSNFIQKSIDEFGRVSGNYELIKDTGAYSGSVWGFDKFKWISNTISNFSEDKVKGQFNNQDSVSYTDITNINNIYQNISIVNENSIVTSDKSIIQLLHKPTNNVTRVFNVNTGEIYIVTDQGIDQSTGYNKDGLIKISGNTLPSVGDILQTDYNWVFKYDKYSDFDGLYNTYNVRNVTDSIDWGYSSNIKNELVNFKLDSSGNFYQGRATNPITSIVSINKFTEILSNVFVIDSGTFVNRLAIKISNFITNTQSIDSVKLINSNFELYNTNLNNGLFVNSTEIVNANISYVTTIILPTDSIAKENDIVKVFSDYVNVFSSDTVSGSFNLNEITIPSSLVNLNYSNITLIVNYISSITNLISTSINSLPFIKNGNGFEAVGNVNSSTNKINILKTEFQLIKQNISLQKYISLSLSSTEYIINKENIISIIRVSDNAVLWNQSNGLGSIITNGSNYNIILNGLNTPLVNDSVIVFYYANEVKRFQPFTFSNNLIKTFKSQLSLNLLTNKYEISLNLFTNQISGLKYKVLQPNSDGYVANITDGYITSYDGYALLYSVAYNLNTISDIQNKQILIYDATDDNNNGKYDIVGYDPILKSIKIKNYYDNILSNQVSIIRLFDGKEIFENGTIDIDNNKLLIPVISDLNNSDKVFVNIFNYKNLRQSPTILASSISDQIINTGVLTFAGTTINLIEDAVFTVTSNDLTLNLSEVLRKELGLTSSQQIPNNIKIASILKAEKVNTVSLSNNEVISVNAIYDVNFTKINDNTLYSSTMLMDKNLNNYQFTLPSTPNNTLTIGSNNLPKLGDKVRVSFYYIKSNDSESISYTRNGLLYSNKKFAFLDKIYPSSGFRLSQSTKLTISFFTQPILGSRYKVYYNYIAPKENERISIKYNYNKAISNVTLNLENSRQVTADILAKEAKNIKLDLIINVVIESQYLNSTTIVLQDLRDSLNNILTTNVLANIVDTTDIINTAQASKGIDRARIIYFNKNGESGSITKFEANKDEYYTPNQITINIETR